LRPGKRYPERHPAQRTNLARMVSPTSSGSATPESAAPSADWPAKAAARVDDLVGIVRDKSTVPILRGAEVAVYGLVAALLLLVVVVLFSVGVLRLLDVYVFGQRVWASYTLLGALFCVAGLFCLSKRKPRLGGSAK
jgi:hypothetical protein